MINQDGDSFDTEAVCAPLIKMEATLRPAPEFQHLEKARCGETQPCAIEPLTSANSPDPMLHFEFIFHRPRMIFGNDINTLQELLVFARGAGFGLTTSGHAFAGEVDFQDYLRQRFDKSQRKAWWSILQDEFGGLPFLDACDAIAKVIRDWKASRR